MLASQFKLNSSQYNRVFKEGKKVHTQDLVVIVLRHTSSFKAAATVSKKQAKTAILRNYKRRQIYNAIQELFFHGDPQTSSVWMIVLLKKGSLGLSHVDIQNQLSDIHHQLFKAK